MSFPNLTGLLQMSAQKDDEFCKILAEVDEQAKKYVELKAITKNVAEEVDALEIDVDLCQQVADIWQANMKKRLADHELAMECYDNTLVLSNIINSIDLSKITKCDVLEKQMSKQSDWHFKEQLFKRIHEQHTTMENRNVVRELRKAQKENLEATKANAQSNLEIYQLKEHWDEKINEVTKQRNTKIVSLVRGSKELTALREKTNITDDVNQQTKTHQLADIAMEVYDANLPSSFRFFPNVNNFFDKFNSSSSHVQDNMTKNCFSPVSLVPPTTPINSTPYTAGCTAEPVIKKQVHFQFENDSKQSVHNIMDSTTEMETDVLSEENSLKNEQITSSNQVEQQHQRQRNTSIAMDKVETTKKATSNKEVAQLLFEKPRVISNVLLKPAINTSQPTTDPAKRITNEPKISNSIKSSNSSMQPIHFGISSNPSQSNISASIPKSFDMFREMFQIPNTTSIESDSNNNGDNEENNSSLNFEDTDKNVEADDFFFDLANNDGNSDMNNSYL